MLGRHALVGVLLVAASFVLLMGAARGARAALDNRAWTVAHSFRHGDLRSSKFMKLGTVVSVQRELVYVTADSAQTHTGFNNPVLISDANEIIAGHGRVQAAKLLGIITVPTPPSPSQDAVYRFNSSPEIIRLVVMMYVKFPLSPRNVEDLLHKRGIDLCHETVRFWRRVRANGRPSCLVADTCERLSEVGAFEGFGQAR